MVGYVLVLKTIFLTGSGAAIFYGVEHFTFSESVYFVDVTVTTVGFGDNGITLDADTRS